MVMEIIKDMEQELEEIMSKLIKLKEKLADKERVKEEDKPGVSEKGEWARHYDYMVWLCTSIFIIAIVQLAVFSCSEMKLETGLLAILITGSLLYFVASFRIYKHDYMRDMEDVKQRGLRQWGIYTFMIFSIGVYCLYRIYGSIGFNVVWIGLFWVLIVAVLFYEGCYKKGT